MKSSQGYVARKNKTFKPPDVQELMNEALSHVTAERYRAAEQHVIKEEEKMWCFDGFVVVVDRIVINVADDGSVSETHSSDSDMRGVQRLADD